MAVLLLAEWNKDGLAVETARAYSAAQKLHMPIDVLLIGNAPAALRRAARRLPALRRLLLAETQAAPKAQQEALEHGLAEPVAALLASMAAAYTVFMAAATSYGKNIMPRLAGLLQVAQISDIIAVPAPDTFKRPIYAGNVIETVRALADKKVVTVRASAFPLPAMAETEQGAEEKLVLPQDLPVPTRFIDEKGDKKEGEPGLGTAKIIVSGGRGFGTAENFKNLLEPLAAKLPAAIGASRAAVDAGFAPNDRQIGQTGRVVSPDLYIAIGLSGAVQHLAGMMDSRVIVAINKDAEAPIFQVADYGLVGDLFEIIPALIKKLG
ncbi:electron transfer flavoprotein subunit alpha/FixB family protein [Candidatus Tokpelaia sp.]|uniref:electron transfer flavoprotein subunit alpha/FixB family protein n=1 Tax=Candidatus Tokpelaia sp. TaxID=2233777 RepID=UPI0012389395|nr:FAD-binding protein [Candidatus Tokpelaia sp.]KAA6405487.1 electron transfer flavoprotein subunit alpha/FixB family protein [Candidatus Tokpelaia sp.]